MEIVVTGRNVEVPDHFRIHVTEKVSRLERYDHKIIGMQVELFHEPNRRQLKHCQRVEITGRGCGPAARAEATAGDFYAALDIAIAKLESRLRRSHDRRRLTARRTESLVGRPAPGAVALLEVDPGSALAGPAPAELGNGAVPGPRAHDEHLPEDGFAEENGHCPGRIVRHKEHSARPMTVDDALSRMELVGHDFYLFADADGGVPSVVYRRRGYDYGVIRLVH